MPDVGTLAAALALAILPSAAYLAILNLIDRYEREPWTLVLAGVGLGAVAAPLASIAVLAVLGRGVGLPLAFASSRGADPVVPIVEQVVAGLLLLGLVRIARDELDDALDGLVYGAAIGAGFGAAQSFLFVAGGTGLLGPGTIAAVLAAGLNQAFYGAVFGTIVGAAHEVHAPSRRWTIVGLGLATAALLSALHDSLPFILARVLDRPAEATGLATRALAFLVNVLGLITLAVAVVGFWRREALVLRVHLAGEIRSGLVSDDDVETLISFRRRARRQLGALRGRGPAGALRVARLYATAAELGFLHWHAATGSTAGRRAVRKDAAVEAARTRIRVLRSEIDAAAGGGGPGTRGPQSGGQTG